MPTYDIPSLQQFESGDTAPTVRNKLNANAANTEAYIQLVEDHLEGSGVDGVLWGLGLVVSAGSGLSVNLTAGAAYVGFRIEVAAKGNSSGEAGYTLGPNGTYWCWLGQDGKLYFTTSSTPPSVQRCVLLAKVVTGQSGVTSVDNQPDGKSYVPDWAATWSCGSDVAIGDCVYITGTSVAKARADSASTMPGYVVAAKPGATTCRLAMPGQILPLHSSLSSAGPGDLGYVSPTAAGAYTTSPPTSPNWQQKVVEVLDASRMRYTGSIANEASASAGSHTQNTDTGTTSASFTLNNDATGAPTENCSLEVERGTSADVRLRWNEADDAWEHTRDGSTYKRITTDHTELDNKGTNTHAQIDTHIADTTQHLTTSEKNNLHAPNTDTGTNSATFTLLNSQSGTPTQNAALQVERGSGSDVAIRWNESTDTWQFTNDGTTWNNIPSVSSGAPTDASYVTLNPEAGLSNETQHHNISYTFRHPGIRHQHNRGSSDNGGYLMVLHERSRDSFEFNLSGGVADGFTTSVGGTATLSAITNDYYDGNRCIEIANTAGSGSYGLIRAADTVPTASDTVWVVRCSARATSGTGALELGLECFDQNESSLGTRFSTVLTPSSSWAENVWTFVGTGSDANRQMITGTRFVRPVVRAQNNTVGTLHLDLLQLQPGLSLIQTADAEMGGGGLVNDGTNNDIRTTYFWDSTNNIGCYRCQNPDQATAQDRDVYVTVRLSRFLQFALTGALQFRYRTSIASGSTSIQLVEVRDDNGGTVTLSPTPAALQNTSWTTTSYQPTTGTWNNFGRLIFHFKVTVAQNQSVDLAWAGANYVGY